MANPTATPEPAVDATPAPIIDVDDSHVTFLSRDGPIVVIDGVSFHVDRGESVAIVFQDPMTTLNPVLTIGTQVAETLLTHDKCKKHDVQEPVAQLLGEVGIPEARDRMKNYPHEFSGGMRQRVMIAMAMACEPDLLIADEPTTALDVTVQAQVLDLVDDLREEHGTAMILITHDLGVVAGRGDRTLVMYSPRPLVRLSLRRTDHRTFVADRLQRRPRRRARPVTENEIDKAVEDAKPAQPILEVKDLRTYFPIRKGVLKRKVGDLKAVDGVSFKLARGETLGVVGESGCGKSTMLRTVIRLVSATSGSVHVGDVDVLKLKRSQLRHFRHRVQMVFQDPYEAVDPHMPTQSIIEEPLTISTHLSRNERLERVAELLPKVGLRTAYLDRYPHEFSGGQRQRIGIARALALEPEIMLLDEPVSALDVSLQAQVLNVFEDLQDELGIAYVLVAHDVSVVRHTADRIMVMYLGKAMEMGDTEPLTTRPSHPYTQALLSAVPVPDPPLERAAGRAHDLGRRSALADNPLFTEQG